MRKPFGVQGFGGLFGLASGTLFLVALSFGATTGSATAEEILADFEARRLAFGVFLILLLVFAFLAVGYFLALRDALKLDHALLATAAATLFIVAFVTLAAVLFFSTTMLVPLAEAYARGGQERTAAIVLANALMRLDAPPLLGSTSGAGLLALGLATRDGKSFPRPLGYAAIVGGGSGLAGWLFDLVHPPELFVIAQVLVSIWALVYFSLHFGFAAFMLWHALRPRVVVPE